MMLCLTVTAAPAGAAEATTLADYLARAREAGINIIYASSLVTRSQTLDVAGDAPFTLEQLRRHLPDYGLVLEAVSPDTYVLRRGTRDTPNPAVVRETPVMEEIVVHSSVYRWTRRTDGGTYLNGQELVRRPVLANDALRVVNQLPGSASVGVSVRPRVRGGREDETLIEFDRVRLYNPFHIESYNSLYSAFDERLVADLAFYSGAYPISYGDSLSAAMLISPPAGPDLEDRRELGMGLYQLSYFQSAVYGNSSLLTSLRRSGPEAGAILDEKALGHPEFADAFLRYERQRDDGSTWSGNLLWYGDDLSLGGDELGETADSHYESGYAWASLRSAPAAALGVETIIGAGYLENMREGFVDQPGKVSGALHDDLDLVTIFANQDFHWGSDRTRYSLGWDYRYMDARFDAITELTIAPAFTELSNLDRADPGRYQGKQHVHMGAAFIGWKHRAARGLYVDLGLRVDARHYENRSDNEGGYRLGLLYQISPTVDIRLAAGRYSQAQNLNELPVADRDSLVRPPQVARQVVLALDWDVPVLGAGVQLEVYRKDAQQVNAYYDNLSNAFTLLPELQPDRVRVDAGKYRASGLELSLDVPLSWGELWLNYAYSSAEDLVAKRYVPRGWDQGRTFNAGFQATLGAWDLAVSGSFHEGWLTTPLTLSGDTVVAGPRNSQRFDHFASLDIKAIRRWRLRDSELRLEAGVSNLADRGNVVGADYTIPRYGSLNSSPFYAPSRTAVLDLYWAF